MPQSQRSQQLALSELKRQVSVSSVAFIRFYYLSIITARRQLTVKTPTATVSLGGEKFRTCRTVTPFFSYSYCNFEECATMRNGQLTPPTVQNIERYRPRVSGVPHLRQGQCTVYNQWRNRRQGLALVKFYFSRFSEAHVK